MRVLPVGHRETQCGAFANRCDGLSWRILGENALPAQRCKIWRQESEVFIKMSMLIFIDDGTALLFK
jgi:hypothetical protein